MIGLTATLVREDGREGDVFSLIGPKRFDAPWKEIEAQGFISPAACFEVRIDLPEGERPEYAASPDRRPERPPPTRGRCPPAGCHAPPTSRRPRDVPRASPTADARPAAE